MAQMTGADAEDLERGASSLMNLGKQVGAMRKPLRHQLLTSPWQGQAAERFRHDWDMRHGPALAEAEEYLRRASDQLRSEAAQQRTAADRGGGGRGTPTPAPTPYQFPSPVLDGFVRWEPGRKPFNLRDLWDDTTGALNVLELYGIGQRWGNVVLSADAFRGLTRIGMVPGWLDGAGIVTSAYDLLGSVHEGDRGAVAMGAVGLAISGVALVNPQVRLAKAAFDGGYLIGSKIDEYTGFSDWHSSNVVDGYIARTYGTDDLTLEQSKALATRYDGPVGAVRFAGDSAYDTWDRFTGLFR